jgi:hypothetical protein
MTRILGHSKHLTPEKTPTGLSTIPWVVPFVPIYFDIYAEVKYLRTVICSKLPLTETICLGFEVFDRFTEVFTRVPPSMAGFLYALSP